MSDLQKKTAPRAATPETDSNKNVTTNSITDDGEKIKVVAQNPGEISRIVTIPNTLEALQEQLDNASMTEVAVETVEVPATKEIFDAYCDVVENAFGVLLDFVSRNKDYIKPVFSMLDKFDELLTDI